MTRKERLAALAKIIVDYRGGEAPQPNAAHVDRWVSQFPQAVQELVLDEMIFTMARTYFSRASVEEFLAMLAKENKLAGKDPCKYWPGASFLTIQQNGESQAAMLELFDLVLKTTCKLSLAKCQGKDGPFIYLDDVLFTGSRVGSDLESWIATDAPKKASVHVITMAIHRFGEWKIQNRLKDAAKLAGKSISVDFWCSRRIENRRAYRDSSEVLWPAQIPADKAVKEYAASEKKWPHVPRQPGADCKEVFSSENGRALLEQEFLKAGVAIRGFCANPKPIMRPLGFSRLGFGFGSMIATYRNCPNNAPLALWWGDPTAAKSHPFSKWYPLPPRKTYQQQGVDLDEILF